MCFFKRIRYDPYIRVRKKLQPISSSCIPEKNSKLPVIIPITQVHGLPYGSSNAKPYKVSESHSPDPERVSDTAAFGRMSTQRLLKSHGHYTLPKSQRNKVTIHTCNASSLASMSFVGGMGYIIGLVEKEDFAHSTPSATSEKNCTSEHAILEG